MKWNKELRSGDFGAASEDEDEEEDDEEGLLPGFWVGLVIVVPARAGGNIFGDSAGLGLPLNVSVAKSDVCAAGMTRGDDAIDRAEWPPAPWADDVAPN